MTEFIDHVRDVIKYNNTPRNLEERGESPTNGDERSKRDMDKIILYNLRYNHSKNIRSDIDVLEEYNYLVESVKKISELKKNTINNLNEINNPSTVERLSRTFITWAWSDDPRKERIVSRKKMENEIRDLERLISEVEYQLPLYKSIISITTNVKKSKLKSKYLKKIKGSKHK